jgi:hypothetical protein
MQHRISILCLQETKVANLSVSMINDIMGSDFDYLCLPVHGAAGGVLIAWRSDLWDGTLPNIGRFSVTIRLRALSSYS